MSKLGKFCVGVSVFLLMSGGLLAVSGWLMGAETHLNYERDEYTVEFSPFNIWFSGGSVGRWANHYAYDYEYDYDYDYDYDYEYETGSMESGGWEGAYTSSGIPAFEVPGEFRDKVTTLRSDDPFQSIDIEVGMGEIVFQQADSYGVELSYYGKGYSLQMENDDGALRVWSEDPQYFGNRIDEKWGGRVTVSVPQNAVFEKVLLDAAMGDVYAGGFRTGYLFVDASMGSAALTGLASEDTEMKLEMGSLTVEGAAFTGALSVKCSMGSIDIEETSLDCDVDLDANMGQITVSTTTPESRYSLDFHTSMGTITRNGNDWPEDSLESGDGDYQFNADCSMGSVDVSFGVS